MDRTRGGSFPDEQHESRRRKPARNQPLNLVGWRRKKRYPSPALDLSRLPRIFGQEEEISRDGDGAARPKVSSFVVSSTPDCFYSSFFNRRACEIDRVDGSSQRERQRREMWQRRLSLSPSLSPSLPSRKGKNHVHIHDGIAREREREGQRKR